MKYGEMWKTGDFQDAMFKVFATVWKDEHYLRANRLAFLHICRMLI